MNLLQRSCRELHQALIAVTHDARAATYASRVVFIRDGRIVSQLRFEEQEKMHDRLEKVNRAFEALEAEGYMLLTRWLTLRFFTHAPVANTAECFWDYFRCSGIIGNPDNQPNRAGFAFSALRRDRRESRPDHIPCWYKRGGFLGTDFTPHYRLPGSRCGGCRLADPHYPCSRRPQSRVLH